MVDVAHDRDHRRALVLVALHCLDMRQQFALGVAGVGMHGRMPEFLGHQHRGVVVDGLGDGGHHAHLEQLLDHVASLQRELLRKVGHGDRVADGDLAHHRRNRLLEPGAGARLVERALALLRLAAGIGAAAAARTIRRGQVQLAGEARGVVVVLDAGNHRVRTAVRGLALVGNRLVGLARGCGLRMTVVAGLGLAGIILHRRFSSSQAGAFGGGIRSALDLREFLRALAILGGKRQLFGLVALARLGELAMDLGHLGVGIACCAWLVQGDFLAHDHVDRARAAPRLGVAANGDFLLAAAVEHDLAGRDDFLRGAFGLAVRTLEEAQQLHFLDAGDDLVGAAEAHAGLGQLLQQFLDRRIHQFGQLADGGLLRHSDSGVFGRHVGGREINLDSGDCRTGLDPSEHQALRASARLAVLPALIGITRTSACALP